MATWEEIKIFTLQKMFELSGDALIENNTTRPYIKSMPQAANEGLQLLATAGKFITRECNITQNPIENDLPMPLTHMEIKQHLNDDLPPYTLLGGKAYYFEVDNPAVIEIKVGGVLVETITHTEKFGFAAYKGLINNPNNEMVSLEFKGGYPYQITNVALYKTNFASDDDVWSFVPEVRYNLREITRDFYKLKEIVKQSGKTKYEKTTGYHREGESVIVLDGMERGLWKIIYYAYPDIITKLTPNDYQMALDPEVEVLLPLYMASQLFKDDDIGMATQWRNEFEVARAELRPTEPVGTVEFTSESRW